MLRSTRTVIHFDLDAFYVACERELNPELRNVPVGVSQYNPYGNLQERAPTDIHDRLVTSQNSHEKQNDVNGSLIAVSYEARAAGVKRNDRGLEAIQQCPSLHIVVVPVKHGKASLTMYRNASKRVMKVLSDAIRNECSEYSSTTKDDVLVEVASIDEVYVDVTEPIKRLLTRMKEDGDDDSFWKKCIQEASTCTTIGGVEVLSDAAEATNALDKNEIRKGSCLQVLDSDSSSVDTGSLAWWNRSRDEWSDAEMSLACGAWVAAQARRAVASSFDGSVFTLSAGISCNKTLAKLASGLKKPNRQAIIDPANTEALQTLFHPLPLSRIRGLGGKFGAQIAQQFQITTVGQVSEIPLPVLQSTLDNKTAQFLHNVSRGICRDPVTPRMKPKSIESSKTFRGVTSISSNDKETLAKWIGELIGELTERLQEDLQENNRTAGALAVGIVTSQEGKSVSKSCRAPRTLDKYKNTALSLALQLVEAQKTRLRVDAVTVTCMSVSATQFVEQASGSSTIMAAFERCSNEERPANSSNARPISRIQHRQRPAKPSMMDNWLSNSNSTKASGTKRRSNDEETSVNKRHAARLDSPSTKRAVAPANDTSGTTEPVVLPTMDEIDPQFLRELPEELRASLMRDIGRAHPTKQTNGIQSFFRPKEGRNA